jgi:hypothetical protein
VDDVLGPDPWRHKCPRVNWHFLNLSTGQRAPGRCRAARCPVCGPLQALEWARVISHGGATGPPERYAVLTLPESMWDMGWQPLRQKMRDYRRLLNHRSFEWEAAWTAEKGNGGNLHVNALQKGSYIPQAVLQDVWGGIVHIQRIRRRPHGVAGYVLKEARSVAGYALKNAGDDERAAYLAMNGGRLAHMTRGYLGGETKASVLRALREQTGEHDRWIRADGAEPPGRSGAELARAALVARE